MVVVLPAEQRFLRADGELLPANQPVSVLRVQARVTTVPSSALIHNFVERPAEGQEGQNLGDRIRPCILHIVHATFHELGTFLVLCAVTAGLDAPIRLPEQNFDGIQNGAAHFVILRHFTVYLDTALALKFSQKFFREHTGIAALADAAVFFHASGHRLSPHFFQ